MTRDNFEHLSSAEKEVYDRFLNLYHQIKIYSKGSSQADPTLFQLAAHDFSEELAQEEEKIPSKVIALLCKVIIQDPDQDSEHCTDETRHMFNWAAVTIANHALDKLYLQKTFTEDEKLDYLALKHSYKEFIKTEITDKAAFKNSIEELKFRLDIAEDDCKQENNYNPVIARFATEVIRNSDISSTNASQQGVFDWAAKRLCKDDLQLGLCSPITTSPDSGTYSPLPVSSLLEELLRLIDNAHSTVAPPPLPPLPKHLKHQISYSATPPPLPPAPKAGFKSLPKQLIPSTKFEAQKARLRSFKPINSPIPE